MDLGKKKCKPCEGDTPPLKPEEVSEYLKNVDNDWEVRGGEMISREYSFENFRQTMDFVNKVAELADDEDHHPDMHVSYGKVVIELTTHAIGGLSENDFIMAYKIDRL